MQLLSHFYQNINATHYIMQDFLWRLLEYCEVLQFLKFTYNMFGQCCFFLIIKNYSGQKKILTYSMIKEDYINSKSAGPA